MEVRYFTLHLKSLILFSRCVANLFIGSGMTGNLKKKYRSRVLHVFSAFFGAIQSLKLAPDENSPIPPLNTLALFRISKQLEEKFEQALVLDNKEWDRVTIDFLCCYVVFTFFYGDFMFFTSVVEKIFERYEVLQENLAHPDVLVYILLFLRSHSESNFGFFNMFKKQAERCFILFPNNRQFMTFYMDTNKRGMDSLNARRLFEKCIKESVDVEPWLYFLEYERQRMIATSVLPSDQKVSLTEKKTIKSFRHLPVRKEFYSKCILYTLT